MATSKRLLDIQVLPSYFTSNPFKEAVEVF